MLYFNLLNWNFSGLLQEKDPSPLISFSNDLNLHLMPHPISLHRNMDNFDYFIHSIFYTLIQVLFFPFFPNSSLPVKFIQSLFCPSRFVKTVTSSSAHPWFMNMWHFVIISCDKSFVFLLISNFQFCYEFFELKI